MAAGVSSAGAAAGSGFEAQEAMRASGSRARNLKAFGHLGQVTLEVSGDKPGGKMLSSYSSTAASTISPELAGRWRGMKHSVNWRMVPILGRDGEARLVALMSDEGYFLTTSLLRGFFCGYSTRLGPDEVFEYEEHWDGSISFKGSSGRYLTARRKKKVLGMHPPYLFSRVGCTKDSTFHVGLSRWHATAVSEGGPIVPH